MARRVALARAIALDPMLVMYDEPFAGLDPISLGVVGQLIRKLNDALGITSIVVTHDIYESLKIVDYLYFVSERPHRRAGHAGRSARVDRSVRAPVRRRRARRPGAVPLPARARSPRSSPVPADAHRRRRCAASARGDASARSARLGYRGALLRGRAASFALGAPAPAAHAARDLLRRRAVAGDHPGVRASSSAWCWRCRATTR